MDKIPLSGLLEAPSHPQVHAIEVTQQKGFLAEACLQLQRHQQLAPFPCQGVASTDPLWIEAAGQLLGDRAAPLQPRDRP